MLFNWVDRGMTIEDAIAAPRASQRNTADVTAEPEFVDQYGAALTALGHSFAEPTPEIGAATAIELAEDGLFIAVAEPVRRGGGAAYVVEPGAP
jgi:gamma-glutamyltranspeptidase/glutathione hydrolase